MADIGSRIGVYVEPQSRGPFRELKTGPEPYRRNYAPDSRRVSMLAHDIKPQRRGA